MRLGQTWRAGHARTFRRDRGLRRLRPWDETAYLMSSPEDARRLLAALEDSRADRGMMHFASIDELRAALRLAEGE